MSFQGLKSFGMMCRFIQNPNTFYNYAKFKRRYE